MRHRVSRHASLTQPTRTGAYGPFGPCDQRIGHRARANPVPSGGLARALRDTHEELL
ncbi:hypothetical protein K530_51970 [Streptomyces noursei CCRC 11814]|uniref:Uncharacterized protein n=1 Tax=Streptomyces noursei TaxID=1971 RepID=A0A401QSU3_STRNR|nr:hypothetical protein K530_51970 [Streptomyces noursei CCRC 11814]GCB88464.1 hypothetical protein SALB_01134 [Streptomyces noursei]